MNEEKDIVYRDDRNFSMMDAVKAQQDLQEYKSGKASIDQKATDNHEWWRLRHWDVIRGETNEGKKAHVEVGSAWTINSLLNKHADMMDSFPKPNILPRDADDEEEAQMLSSIIPSILEQNDYEEIYRNMGWDLCIDGAAVTGVFWDSNKRDGIGDVSLANVDVHNIFWQPGIEDIQDSDKVFVVTLEDIDEVKNAYPDIADKIGPMDAGTVAKYIHDDNIDVSNCVEVVNMYYKKTYMQPVYMDGLSEDGKPTKVKVHEVPKTVLHMAILIGNEIAFASENEKGYENGIYEHGMYPFVIRRLFPVKDTPWGFGYLDIMKNPQKDIDKLDQAIIQNTQQKAKSRWWVKKNGNINPEQFADWNEQLIEVASGELGDAVRQVDVDTLPGIVENHLAFKVDELKETSGNRDFSQGSTQSGVTAASAIAALQEAGSKLSRDINKEIYRGFREECYLIIELIRQFYDEARTFRVEGSNGGYQFAEYDNSGIKEQTTAEGKHKRPIFDITVTAEKASPFSRAAQNETAKELYGMGLFHPENSIPALVCIDMMDFEGKDKVKQQIQQNSTMLQQFNAAMDIIASVSAMIPEVAQMAINAGLMNPDVMGPPQQGPMQPMNVADGTPEERAAKKEAGNENTIVAKARARAAKGAIPGA